MIPYLIATSFLGLAASRYFTDSEAPLLMIAFFSVGLIFLSGVSYPMELMPWYWKAAHYILPAAPATLAFVQLNSMGASMADIRPEYITLWIQVLVYFILSIWVYQKSFRKVNFVKKIINLGNKNFQTKVFYKNVLHFFVFLIAFV